MRKSCVWIAAAAALSLIAPGAGAEPVGDCGPSIGWVFGGGGGIPDAGSAWFGPAETAGTTCMQEVAVSLDLFHSLVGDLIIRVGYDRDCDGSVDTEQVTLMCRPGRGCTGGSGRGCEARAGSSYKFTGNVSEKFADPCPSDVVPLGCHGAADGTTFDFNIFQGEQLGGCFRLYVEDAEAGETGFLKAFAVSYTESTCETPVDDASWGYLKAVFEE